MSFRRYAVYHLPDGPLGNQGAEWLGWDVRTGSSCAAMRLEGLPCPPDALTAAPRRYGFHATLKAPFRPAATTDLPALMEDVAALAARVPPVSAGGLEPARLSRFVALRPAGETAGLEDLAARVVERLDRHRAPITAEERARRGRLTPEESRLFERWGYPHVMERFRFHVTLTGPVPDAAGEAVLAALRPVFAPLCPRRFVLDAIALVGEGEDGMFRLIRRYPLSG